MTTFLLRFIPASLTIAALGLPSAFAQTTERVSVDSLGGEGNQWSILPSISADGRYVAFESWAGNLVPGDTNNDVDIFVHNRQTGQASRVSVDSAGVQGNARSGDPSISADGRYVAFSSSADNLVPSDTNGTYDIFVHDRQTSQTTRVSVNSLGLESFGWLGSRAPAISADGRTIAFWSDTTSLVPGDTNGVEDAFVHDRQTGQTTRVSVSSAGGQGNGNSSIPAISADGRYVAFWSVATNLVLPFDLNGDADIFVHDRQTGQTTRVSVDSQGVPGDDRSSSPAISADGRYVAFDSHARNLVPGDTNTDIDVFVHDRQTGQTSRVSMDSAGVQGNLDSLDPSISTDGQYVSFSSSANNLVPGDTNNSADIFFHDRQTSLTSLVSVDSAGVQGNRSSQRRPAISADGRYVAFDSDATNLVPGDTNAEDDIFVHDRARAIDLSKIGTCDGQVALAIEHATPFGIVAFLYGPAGFYSQSGGRCAGLVLGISAPVVGATVMADISGAISYQFFAPPNLCGLTVQAVDLTFCIASEAVVLEPRVFTLAKNRGCSSFQTRVIDLLITGAVPGSPIVLFHGPAGSYVKPGGRCAGTTLGISNPVLIAQVTADAFGDTQYSFTVPPALCGLTVQAVERSGCQVSNTITL